MPPHHQKISQGQTAPDAGVPGNSRPAFYPDYEATTVVP